MNLDLYWVVVRKNTTHVFAAFLAKFEAEEYIKNLGEFGDRYEILSRERYAEKKITNN